jgi:outer membrane protein OmpA-like peptidoglycan-associated protein
VGHVPVIFLFQGENKMLKLTLLTLFFTVISFSMGCANKAKPVEFPEGSNAITEMDRLEADIQQAELDQVDITSPNYFAVAKRKLAEARKLEIEEKSHEKILKTVGEARGNFNYAIYTQQSFRGELNDILTARNMSLKAGALEQYPSEFQRLDADLKDAVKDYKPNKEFLSFSVHQQFKNKYYDLQKRALASNQRVEDSVANTVVGEQLKFDPAEAEVFRDGDKVLIRLKGQNFKPGQSQLSKNVFPALDKVKTILSSMAQAQVKIEGYTDSSGSTEINQRISEGRAEAVADYLITTKSITAEQIEYQGRGSQNPVMPNATQQGRAANRRVDITITPAAIR